MNTKKIMLLFSGVSFLMFNNFLFCMKYFMPQNHEENQKEYKRLEKEWLYLNNKLELMKKKMTKLEQKHLLQKKEIKKK